MCKVLSPFYEAICVHVQYLNSLIIHKVWMMGFPVILKLMRKLAKNYLISGSVLALVITIVGTGISFLTKVYLAQILGFHSYGIYAYTLAWLNVLLIFNIFGMDTLGLRFGARYWAQENWETLYQFLYYCFRRLLFLSFIIAIIVVIVVAFLRSTFEKELADALFILVLVVPVQSTIVIISSLLLSFKDIIRARLPWMAIQPLILICLLFLTKEWFSVNITASLAFFLYGLTCALTLFYLIYILIKKMPKLKGHLNKIQSDWNKTSVGLFLLAFLRLLINRTDIILIGVFLNVADVGIYSVAVTLMLLFDFGLSSVNTVIAPVISDLYSQNKLHKLQYNLKLAAIFIFAYTVCVALAIVFGGKFLLSMFGAEFIEGYPVLLILMLGRSFSAASGSVGLLMTMTAHERDALRILLISAIVSVALNILLIPRLGILGAGLATSLSTIIWNLLMYINVTRTLKVDPSILSIFRGRKRKL